MQNYLTRRQCSLHIGSAVDKIRCQITNQAAQRIVEYFKVLINCILQLPSIWMIWIKFQQRVKRFFNVFIIIEHIMRPFIYNKSGFQVHNEALD